MGNRQKIPVVQTVMQALQLTVSNWRTVLQIMWLPTVLSALASIWPLTRFPNRDLAGLSADELNAAMMPYNGLSFVAALLANLIMLMAMVGLFRFYLRQEKPRGFFYLHWGMDEWRVLGGAIVRFLAVLATCVASMVLVFFASAILGIVLAILGVPLGLEEFVEAASAGDFDPSILLSIGGLWVLVMIVMVGAAVAWITGRVSFFYAGPVAEEKLDIAGLFKATEGHALQLILVLLLLFLVSYSTLFVFGVIVDFTLMQGAIAMYYELTNWSAMSGPLSFDAGSQTTKLMIGGFAMNFISKLAIAVVSAGYVLTYLHVTDTRDG